MSLLPESWLPQRRRVRRSDVALTGATRLWLRLLPPRRRPLRLCARHPHVANRMAWCWRDDELIASVLQDLFEDRRGGRAGFAPEVVRELQRLRDYRLAGGS